MRKLFTDVEARPTEALICRSLAPVDVLPKDWPNDRLRRWEHPLDGGGSVNALFAPSRGGTQFGIDTSLYGGDQLLDLDDEVVPVERLLRCYPEDADPIVINALEANLIATRAYRLFDLPEIEVWSGNSVALLGDAAHAMRPLLGQGASQAIQDADELTRCLVREAEVGEALRAYEQVRAPFTAAIQRAAREFRPRYIEILANAEKQPTP